MPIQIATVRDTQSAEYLKSLALAEADQASALVLWRQARGLDPDSTTLICHEALALFHLDKHERVLTLELSIFFNTQGLCIW